jgi:hypothetical protein
LSYPISKQSVDVAAGPTLDPLTRREVLLSALVSLLLAAIVLWEPIIHLSTHTFGPWDWLPHSSSLLRTTPDSPCVNTLVTDPVREMLPWTVFGARELAAGRLPLWNPHNATGAPLFANYQSAFLSPFQLPFFVLPLKFAELASALAKLFVAGWLTYLFLRTLALSRIASSLGAAVFAFAGGQMLVSLLPHSGVTAVLPGALLAAEKMLAALESELRGGPRVAGRVWWPVLALSLGVAALAGHPEMLFADVVVVGAWCAARLAACAVRHRDASGSLARCTRTGVALAAAGLVGLALATPQVIAFLEYFAHSDVARQRTLHAALGIDRANWPLQVFPDLAGSPVGDASISGNLPAPNYEVCNLFYVGALPLFLALSAVALGVLRTRMALFAALACVATVRIGSFNLLDPLVSTGLFPLLQPYVVWQISIAVLAAWAVDRLVGASRATQLAWLLAAAAFIVAFRWFASRYIDGQAAEAEIEPAVWSSRVAVHITSFSAWFALGAAALGVTAMVRDARARSAAALVALAAHVAATGLALAPYVPTVEDRFVLPSTPALEEFRRLTDSERVLFLGRDAPNAEANCALGISLLTSYDGVGLADVQRLASQCFGALSSESVTLRASRRALDLFGVRFVSTPYDWVAIDTEMGSHSTAPGRVTPYLGLAERAAPNRSTTQLEIGAAGVSQVFVPERDGLSALVLHVVSTPASDANRIELALHAAPEGPELARLDVGVNELRVIAASRRECVLRFDPIEHSAGQAFVLDIRCPASTGARPVLRRLPSAVIGGEDETDPRSVDRPGRGWSLSAGDQPAAGRVVIDLAYGRDFAPRASFGAQRLHEVVGSLGSAWIVGDAAFASDHEDAWTHVIDPSFDPRRSVVLEGGPRITASDGVSPKSTLTALERTPTALRFHAACAAPSYLVLAQPNYPGWRARVDGRDVPLRAANYCFCAVELPAGESEIDVDYEPRWLWPSLAVACADLLLLIAVLVRELRRV